MIELREVQADIHQKVEVVKLIEGRRGKPIQEELAVSVPLSGRVSECVPLSGTVSESVPVIVIVQESVHVPGKESEGMPAVSGTFLVRYSATATATTDSVPGTATGTSGVALGYGLANGAVASRSADHVVGEAGSCTLGGCVEPQCDRVRDPMVCDDGVLVVNGPDEPGVNRVMGCAPVTASVHVALEVQLDRLGDQLVSDGQTRQRLVMANTAHGPTTASTGYSYGI